MSKTYRYARYTKFFDLAGKNLIITGEKRDALRHFVPELLDPAEMEQLTAEESDLTTLTGEIADEVHAFTDAVQNTRRLDKVLLKNGEIIQVVFEKAHPRQPWYRKLLGG